MKKTLALALSFMFLLSTLVGCSNTPADESGGDSGDSAQTETVPNVDSSSENSEESVPTGGAFDNYIRPQIVEEGETFRLGVLARELTSESINRIDHQLQIECAHRGWILFLFTSKLKRIIMMHL